MHPFADLPPDAAAERLRAHLAAIVESSLDAIVSKDFDGIVTSWNRGAERIFGYTAQEMIGRPVRLLIPEDRQHEEDHILLQLRRGERVPHFDTVRRTRDGRLIDVSVTVSPILDARGQVVGASKIARDMTALREQERELQRMARLYDALSQVNQAIVWSGDRDELFQRVCRVLVERGGLLMAWIGWMDPDTQRLVPVSTFGDEGGYLARVSIHADERPEGLGPAGTSFRSGQPCVSNDIASDPRMAPWREAALAAGLRATTSLPLRQGGEVVGVLSVSADRPGFFRDREMALLVEAAMDLSFALDNLAREAARQQVDEALREEMQFSQTMLDSMPGVVYFYDASGRFLRWNRNFETVTGRSADEVARMHPLDFFLPAEQPRLEQAIARVFADGEAAIEADFLVAGGGTRPFLFTGRRVDLRGQACLVGVGIDIGERKRAEAALHESRSHLLAAQRIAGIGSWTLDLRSGGLDWSDQACEIFGVERAAAAVDSASVLRFVHPEDRIAVQAGHDAVLAGGAPLDLTYRIVLHDGSERVVREQAALRRHADGRPLALEGTVHDVTAHARLEAERERRHRAEAADRVKSAFLANMSHELRTPLNSIVGFTGILLRGLPGPLNAEQTKQLGMVQSSARHLLALVNDVLDISKIEAGQMEVARLPFDARRSLDKVLELVAPQARARRLALRAELPPDLGTAVGDVRRFEQILLNLLSNALKFTEQGEVVVTAEVLPGGRDFEVSVADTGIGIGPEDLEGLFQPFRQVETGLARSHEGTGLGLAICRHLAGLMDGSIRAESRLGHGSRFTVTMPLQRDGGT